MAPNDGESESSASRVTSIGIWGRFDRPSLEGLIVLQVVRAEMSRRRPDLTVRTFAPHAVRHALARGEAIESLEAAITDTRHRRALEDELSLSVLCGDGLVSDPDDSAVALMRNARAWHAVSVPTDAVNDQLRGVASMVGRLRHVSLLADGTSDRLRAVGVEGPLRIVPHPALLAPRVLPPALLAQRLAFLRTAGWWPPVERVAVVEIGARSEQCLDSLADNVRGLDVGGVVLVPEDEERDRPVATRLRRLLGADALVLPEIASLEDRAAAVAGATMVIACSPVAAALACAYGRPIAWAHEMGGEGDDAFHVYDIHDDRERLDEEYDMLAAAVAGDAPGYLTTSEVIALRDALDARARRLAAERLAYGDHLHALDARHELERARADEELTTARARILDQERSMTALEAELAVVTSPPHKLFARLARKIMRARRSR